MSLPAIKVGLSAVSFVNSFWGFEESQYQARIRQLEEEISRFGCKLVSTKQSFSNAEEGQKAAGYLKSENVDFVILDIATFPEGKAYKAFLDQVEAPFALWSRPEDLHGCAIGHNSFCGANFAAGNLTREHRRFRTLFGRPDSSAFRARLETALSLVRAAAALRGSKIGMVGGGIVPKFFDIDFTEQDKVRLKARWQIEVTGIPLSEMLGRAEAQSEAAVAKEVARQSAFYKNIKVDQQALAKQARITLALQALAAERNLAAMGVRCWPEMQSEYAGWPCGAIGALNQLGLPVACEGDPVGALDMLLATKFSQRPATLMDIVDLDENTLSIWHCGPTAPDWAAAGVDLIPHNVDGKDQHGQPKPGLPCVHNMTFKPGPVRLLRTLGALDDEFVVDGQILKAGKRSICGCFGLVGKLTQYGSPVSPCLVREQLFSRGIPHHYAAFYVA